MFDIENERNHHLIVNRENYEANFFSDFPIMCARDECIDDSIVKHFESLNELFLIQEYECYVESQKPNYDYIDEYYFQNFINSYEDLSPEDFINDEPYYDSSDYFLNDDVDNENFYYIDEYYDDEENELEDYDYPEGPDENLSGVICSCDTNFTMFEEYNSDYSEEHFEEEIIDIDDGILDFYDSEYQKLENYYENLINNYLDHE